MNILFWILQSLLALHTAAGAVWKLSNSQEIMPSLTVIPNWAWRGLSAVELVLSVCLIVPAFYKPAAFLVPLAAVLVAVEMLAFSGLHLSWGEKNHSPMIYWLVVAAYSLFVAYGRFVLKPH